MEKIVTKLNKLMQERGMNCVDLSKKTGIPNTTLSTLLKGRTDKIDIIKLRTICECLGCSLDYVINDNIEEDTHTYYLDDEAAQYAQEIANNKDLKMLFDAAKDIKKEDMQFVYEMIKRFKNNAE